MYEYICMHMAQRAHATIYLQVVSLETEADLAPFLREAILKYIQISFFFKKKNQ